MEKEKTKGEIHRAEILLSYCQDKTIREIAKEVGLSRSYVQLILSKHGCKGKKKNMELTPLKRVDVKRFIIKQGEAFTKDWNQASKDGDRQKVGDKYGIKSMCTFDRVVQLLGLEKLHSGKHPGRRKFIKRIIYWATTGDRSATLIGKMYGMQHESINNILRKEGFGDFVKPKYVTNALLYKTKSGINPKQLPAIIKELYMGKRMTCVQIAKELGIDQGTVSTKLKAMGILVLNHHKFIVGGYPCLWCAEIMEKVWQNKGPKKQKFCSPSCKNQAKDFRRMQRGTMKYSEVRLNKMIDFLKERWHDRFEEITKKLLSTTPAFKKIESLGDGIFGNPTKKIQSSPLQKVRKDRHN